MGQTRRQWRPRHCLSRAPAPTSSLFMRRLLVPFILPPACAWITRHERRILATGVALDGAQRGDATALGIAHPECVRLLAVPRVPLPLSWLARYARPLVGTSFAQTSGLTA